MGDIVDGARVAWTSRLTGRDHTGEIVMADNGRGLAVVRPDGDALRWSAWVLHDDLTVVAAGRSTDE